MQKDKVVPELGQMMMIALLFLVTPTVQPVMDHGMLRELLVSKSDDARRSAQRAVLIHVLTRAREDRHPQIPHPMVTELAARLSAQDVIDLSRFLEQYWGKRRNWYEFITIAQMFQVVELTDRDLATVIRSRNSYVRLGSYLNILAFRGPGALDALASHRSKSEAALVSVARSFYE